MNESWADLDHLFIMARTYNTWKNQPVDDGILHQLYDLLKWGPTSANTCPARFVFVKSLLAKEKLIPCLSPGNIKQTQAAPVTAIIAMDMEFFEKLPKLVVHTDARAWFVGNQPLIEATAFRNSSLQGAYLILAARALGLDCGPMSGFDNGKLDQAFFHGTSWKSNFLCNLGHGDPSGLHARAPRLDFEEACKIL